MSDIAHQNRNELPSTKSLIKAMLLALLVAAVVLIVFILPAEYGIDATGLGSRMGLNAMSTSAPESVEPPVPTTTEVPVAEAAQTEAAVVIEAPSALTAAWKSATPYRSDEMSLTLKPGEGAEIKARMRTGERFVFTWATQGGVVNFDMHGEEFNAKKDEFTSFWKGRGEAEGHGAFVAPFDGTHGWYWRNRGDGPVTVTVKTSGFYEQLFRP